MSSSARFLVETAARQIKPVNGLKRLMTVTPQKREKDINSGESFLARDENAEPLVAFSRPPPIPPVLGPLVMLSLFQVSSRDDDNKDSPGISTGNPPPKRRTLYRTRNFVVILVL